jgi:hypothetical protein
LYDAKFMLLESHKKWTFFSFHKKFQSAINSFHFNFLSQSTFFSKLYSIKPSSVIINFYNFLIPISDKIILKNDLICESLKLTFRLFKNSVQEIFNIIKLFCVQERERQANALSSFLSLTPSLHFWPNFLSFFFLSTTVYW